ncbi:hypothetical protein NG726_11555 [Pseudomonas sp. MOB-449]|nr:hypothetical protein [Pseudomonas sp. MOB-449]
MTMTAILPEDRVVLAQPAPRNRKSRPGYLAEDVLLRAAEDGERRLMARVEQMRGKCQQ